MPELPEVEVTRLSFANRIASAQIQSVQMGKPLRWPLGCAPDALHGQQVLGVRRRGKYLLLDLSQGLLLVHLGMSGSISFGYGLPPPGKHDHFEMLTSLGTLRLHDPRRFGAVLWAGDDVMQHKLLMVLGVEPMTAEFSAEQLYQATRGRAAAIKLVLMDSHLVVGVGNIYANEALFAAGINPKTCANRLSLARLQRLVTAVNGILCRI